MIDGIRRSCPVPAFSCAPAWRLECRVLQNRLSRFCRVWRTRIDLPVPPGASLRRTPHPTTFSAAFRPSPGDARGEAPCIKITLDSPFPTGEGGGGGLSFPFGEGRARKQTKGRVGRRPTGQVSRRDSGGRENRFPHAPPPPRRRGIRPPHHPASAKYNLRKVLGGSGDSFKSPPAYPRIPVSPHPTKNAWLLPRGSSHAEGITFPVRPGSSGRTRYWRT